MPAYACVVISDPDLDLGDLGLGLGLGLGLDRACSGRRVSVPATAAAHCQRKQQRTLHQNIADASRQAARDATSGLRRERRVAAGGAWRC
eukprot:229833-Rhodomonas_salina.1